MILNSYEILRTIKVLTLYTYNFTTSKWKIHYGYNDSFSKTLLNVRSQSTSFIEDMYSQHLHSQGAFLICRSLTNIDFKNIFPESNSHKHLCVCPCWGINTEELKFKCYIVDTKNIHAKIYVFGWAHRYMFILKPEKLVSYRVLFVRLCVYVCMLVSRPTNW